MSLHADEIPMAGPSITDAEVAAVTDALKNGWYGKEAYHYVELFESEFASFHGRRYALMTPNCTSALHLLLNGLGIGEGDEVIVPDCTWVGSVAGVVYLKAKPVFGDIQSDSWCLDPVSVMAAITDKTKAVIVVGLYGNMPEMDKLAAICHSRDIVLIEDAAESIGSRYKGRLSGSFGKASVFSFHRTKTLTTGEGGMLLLDDEDLFKRCHFLRDHGRSPTKAFYTMEVTHKYMPFNMQAALGHAQFGRLQELVGRKREILSLYRQHLADLPDLSFNFEPESVFNSAWMSTLVVGKSYGLDKLQMIEQMAKLGVPARPFFYPLSSLPAFPGNEAYQAKNLIAYDVSARAINLPCALVITDEQIKRVSQVVRKILEA